jgi:hypothetical protein
MQGKQMPSPRPGHHKQLREDNRNLTLKTIPRRDFKDAMLDMWELRGRNSNTTILSAI